VKVAISRNERLLLSRIERVEVNTKRGDLKSKGEKSQAFASLLIMNCDARGISSESKTIPAGWCRIFVRLVKPGETLNIRPPNVDERGHFFVVGLFSPPPPPPGSYEITDRSLDGMRNRHDHVKQTVVLEDGVTTDVNIIWILRLVPNREAYGYESPNTRTPTL
jgi:hypothetical protein